MVDPLRLAVFAALLAGAGSALVLSEFRWFKQGSLTERLLPFSGSTTNASQRSLRRSSAPTSLHATIAPGATALGERLAKLFGVEDDLTTRLRRAASPLDAPAFRMRQLGWITAALATAFLIIAAIRPPALTVPLLVLGAPLLAFLVLEQQVMTAIRARQRALFVELPVVSEQLAMLLSVGHSLGSALNRLAERNGGTSGGDLKTVCERIRHGLTTARALQEWADLADVPELRRLVTVLTLSNETSDLGRLVAEEAKSIRREAQRQLVETIERRGQQVWVPVTVATLVPGVIFLTIPFLQALELFSNS